MVALKRLPNRFLTKIRLPENQESCWEWLNAKFEGYVRVGYNGKTKLAHRIIYELTVKWGMSTIILIQGGKDTV